MSLALAGTGGLKGRLGRAYLGARGYGERVPGDPRLRGRAAGGRRAGARGRCELVRATAAGCASGARPGEAWLRGRFAAPYLRDELLTHGVMVETLETATQWSNLQRAAPRGRRARSRARWRRSGTPGLVMCHVSHLYETGASLYFTFIARQREGEEIEQWRAVKRRRRRGDRRRRRHDHPPPRGRARPRAVDGARDRRRRAATRCARSRPSSTPPGS